MKRKILFVIAVLFIINLFPGCNYDRKNAEESYFEITSESNNLSDDIYNLLIGYDWKTVGDIASAYIGRMGIDEIELYRNNTFSFNKDSYTRNGVEYEIDEIKVTVETTNEWLNINGPDDKINQLLELKWDQMFLKISILTKIDKAKLSNEDFSGCFTIIIYNNNYYFGYRDIEIRIEIFENTGDDSLC